MDESMLSSVISTRIRLARNLRGIPFPRKMSAGHADIVAAKVERALKNGYKTYRVKSLGEIEAGAFVERHLISKELLSDCPYGRVVLSDDEAVSVMLNEEDHVREQVILPGYRLDEAYRVADALDDRISEAAEFAFSEKYGYLTACPTNLGTGMRASVMIFLPALTITGELKRNVSTLAKMNVTLRGVYGEGSDALGYVYQVSNKRTLGVTEADILSFVRAAAESIAAAEKDARERLLKSRGNALIDEIARAMGVASCAYMLSYEQAITAVSLVKLGAYYGIIGLKNAAKPDELLISVSPFNLESAADRPLKSEADRSVYRAELVRATIKNIARLNF